MGAQDTPARHFAVKCLVEEEKETNSDKSTQISGNTGFKCVRAKVQ
jgi:hypothetical protein